jgi:prepilin-type N-terminal cleavage/methylation domain-containing protein
MNKRGFTLTEIIISVLIISILGATMFSAFVGVQYFFNCTRHKIQAYNFAREAVGRLRSNYKYTDSPQMDIMDGHLESEIGNIIRGEMVNLDTELTYDVTAGPEAGSYKEVSVNVSWTERRF